MGVGVEAHWWPCCEEVAVEEPLLTTSPLGSHLALLSPVPMWGRSWAFPLHNQCLLACQGWFSVTLLWQGESLWQSSSNLQQASAPSHSPGAMNAPKVEALRGTELAVAWKLDVCLSGVVTSQSLWEHGVPAGTSGVLPPSPEQGDPVHTALSWRLIS